MEYFNKFKRKMINKLEDFLGKYMYIPNINKDIFNKIKIKFKKLGFSVYFFRYEIKSKGEDFIYIISSSDKKNHNVMTGYKDSLSKKSQKISIKEFLEEKNE